MTTITETIPSLGTPPLTSDPSNFDTRADTLYGTSLPAVIAAVNTWAGQANAVATEVNADKDAAAASVTAAQLAESNAEAAQAAAEAASTASGWVSGAPYVAGDVVWSPISFLPYRRKTDGAGTTDPSADNTNWEVQVSQNDIVRVTRSSDVPIVVGNKTNLIDYTAGTFNQTFPAVSTLPEGWFCWLRSTDANVTFVMDGTDTIDKPVMGPGQIYLLISNGVDAIKVVDYSPKGWVFLSEVVASDVATVDIEATFDDFYDSYMIAADGVLPATNSAVLWARLKINGSYQTANYNYMISSPLTNTANNTRTQVSSSDAKIIMFDAAGSTNEALGPTRFELKLSNPESTTTRKTIEWGGVGRLNSANSYLISRFYGGGGYDGGTQALTGVRFLFSTGNIAAGKFRLYGLRRL